ncbi:MAG TPA: hypothetical protein VNI01_05975 [Elusimicrobiota bacterium]|jgi:hypothetical protein|nr:hypothetical protein [Elusimicrobiota bacterium]
MRFLAAALAASVALLAACEDNPQQANPQQPQNGDAEQTASSGSSGGDKGSGDVAIGQSEADKTTIADRYKKALGMIQKHDWDGARAELLEAYQRSSDGNVRKEIREHLQMVEQGLLQQPAFNVPQIFGAADKLYDKPVSIRGLFLAGGAIGKVNYYFWLENGRKIQVRYSQLLLDDKKTIANLHEGSQVLVRGILKSPWGSNPNPYLDATFFRLEHAAQAPAQPAEAAP